MDGRCDRPGNAGGAGVIQWFETDATEADMTAAAMRQAATADDLDSAGDAALAARIAAGDTRAFAHVMRRHNRMLYRMARSILHDDAEAEDCLQSAYLSAYRAIGGFGGRARLSTWLARIVINDALGRKRRTARRGEVIPFDGAAGRDSSASATPATTVPNAWRCGASSLR